MQRPHIKKYWPELRQLALASWDDLSTLSELAFELQHRWTSAGIKLRKKVEERVAELQEQQFKWPSTVADAGNGSLLPDNWPKVGLLKWVGYNTQENGPSTNERRRILDRVRAGRLPNVISAVEMAKWGESDTCQRLRKMADSLAAFARNNKRRQDTRLNSCIEKWESDLEYLRLTYYVGRKCEYKFSWPRT